MRWSTPSTRSRPSAARRRLPSEPHARTAMTIAFVLDAAKRAPRMIGRGLIAIYRYTLSALVGNECRHLPTCSEYADEAIGRFGLWAGGWMTLGRRTRDPRQDA